MILAFIHHYWNAVLRKLRQLIYWSGHPFLGAMTILFLAVHPVVSFMWFAGYMLYQLQEYKEDKDTAALDMRDFLLGYAAAAALAGILWRR